MPARYGIWPPLALLAAIVLISILAARGQLDQSPIAPEKLVTVEGRLDEMQLYYRVTGLVGLINWGWSQGSCGGSAEDCDEYCRIRVTPRAGPPLQFQTWNGVIRHRCSHAQAGAPIVLQHSGPGNFYSMGEEIYAIKIAGKDVYTYQDQTRSIEMVHRGNFALGICGLVAVLALAIWGMVAD